MKKRAYIFIILSGFLFATSGIFVRLLSLFGFSSMQMTATLYCFIFMGILSLSFVNVSEMAQLAMQSPLITSLLAIGIGVFTCGLPYLIYTFALREIPAGTASAMGLIDPMAAIVYGVIFFSEPLSVLNFAGIILILGAVFVLSRE